MTRITVLGNFSGRNAGDNAILGNLLDDVSELYDDVEFLVPTLNPGYVRRACGRHRVRALGLMPWHGALKIFGLSTFYAMLRTDLVLITDNILFDKQYFNPAFNYLSTIALGTPLCRRRGIPVVLYNASLGPINSERGARALQRVLDAGPMAIVRDRASSELVARLGLRAPRMVTGADCALNTVPPPSERIDAIMAETGIVQHDRPLIGFNVNSYIDSWHKGGDSLARPDFVRLMSHILDRLVDELGVTPVFFVTQVMDTGIMEEVKRGMRHGDRVRSIANPRYDYREIAGVMSRLELVVAMRTHAMILSTAMGTPIVNVNAYPKSVNFLETIGMQEWTIGVRELTEDSFYRLIRRAWAARSDTRRSLAPHIAREKARAKASASLLRDLAELDLRQTVDATA